MVAENVDVMDERTEECMIKTVNIDNVISRELLENKLSIPTGMDVPQVAVDGVFIMFHRNSDGFPLMVEPRKWASVQNSGEIAAGVIVVEGGKMLVVAPTEATLLWSSATVNGGGKMTTDRLTALDDWRGRTSTDVQVTKPECNTDNYAPGYCNRYSRVNTNGQGLTAGRWWLPSLGEMLMIFANMQKVNYALSLINGATLLTEAWYWSSTEASTSYAWGVGLGNGIANYGTKNTSQGLVRPVSTFLR